jgi:hypothetical protein
LDVERLMIDQNTDINTLKALLADACSEIAKYKIKYTKSEKRVAELERELHDLRVIRLPVPKVVCR